MTSEKTPTGDSGDAFDALIKASWDHEPSLRELLDAGVRRLLDDAKSLEDSLNSSGTVSEETIQEALLHLNGDWDMLGFGDEALKITGRLRPTEYAEENDVDNLDEDGAFPGLGVRAEDLLGAYLPAAHFRVIMRGFDVETVPLGEHGNAYRIVMQLSLDEDYADEDIWFTAYPDDIEYIEAYQPTREGAEEFIGKNFPELLTAIHVLPDNCQDPELIRQVLDDFAVTFDLSKADTTMGQDEVLDLIETYITDRLAFDNSSYDASVNGLIYGRRMNFDKVPTKYQGTLRQLLIGSVRLFPTPDTTEGQSMVTYRAALETWYLVPEAQGGRTPIYIPIDSLTKLVANRPDARDYPFGEDTFITQNEQMEGDFGVAPLANTMGAAAVELVAQEDSDAPVDEAEVQEGYASEAELVSAYTNELRGLHEVVRQYASGAAELVYDTKADAMKQYEVVSERINAFFERWSNVNTVIEVAGEALRMPNMQITRTLDVENEHVSLNFDNFDIVDRSILNSAKGMLTEATVRVLPIDEDEQKHVIRAYLEFIDLSHTTIPVNINDPETGLTMVTGGATRRFVVDLGYHAGYSIPALEYDERRQQAMERAEHMEAPSKTRAIVTKNLRALAKGIDNESPNSMEEYDGVEGLRDIALSTAGDPSAMNTVADALESIIGTGRPLRLMGPYITETGELVPDQGLLAKLDGVVTQHPHLKANEITFVMLVPAQSTGETDKRFIVPLSTLEEMAF